MLRKRPYEKLIRKHDIIYIPRFSYPLNIDYPGSTERSIVEVSKRLRLRNNIARVLRANLASHKPTTTQSPHRPLKSGVKLHP
jgi:hypothetical protein